MEAVRAVRVVRVPVVRARDEGGAPPLARGGERLAGADVVGEGAVPRGAQHDDRSRVPPRNESGIDVPQSIGISARVSSFAP